MVTIAAVSLLAFILTLLLTPLCRNASRRLGFLDHPNSSRKLHAQPVARIGGLPIFIAVFGSFGIFALLEPVLPLSGPDWTIVARLLPAAGVALATGLIDDLFGLKPWQKLMGQVTAAGIACMAGVQINTFAGVQLAPWLHVPLTILWLVCCSNAVNLVDGVDGLAAGIGLVGATTMLAAALFSGNAALALAAAPLAAALLAFLRFNFNPATIFLGDSGSLSIGFLLGCYGAIWTQKSATVLGMLGPLLALSIPLLEIGLSISRRFLSGRPIFGADRRHIHHRLLDLGIQPRRVAFIMYGAAGLASAVALAISVIGPREGGLLIVLFCAATWLGVKHLGYNEFKEARIALMGGLIGRVVDAQTLLRQTERELAATECLTKRRKILADCSRQFGFNEIRIDVANTTWREILGTAARHECWQLRVPLKGSDFAEFSVALHNRRHPVMLSAFANIVRTSLMDCQSMPHLTEIRIVAAETRRTAPTRAAR